MKNRYVVAFAIGKGVEYWHDGRWNTVSYARAKEIAKSHQMSKAKIYKLVEVTRRKK